MQRCFGWAAPRQLRCLQGSMASTAETFLVCWTCTPFWPLISLDCTDSLKRRHQDFRFEQGTVLAEQACQLMPMPGPQPLDHAGQISPAVTLSAGVQVVQHGACLGLGIAGLGSNNSEIFEEIKGVLFTDGAISGEAAGLALGLLSCGSGTDKAEELLAYAHDTQHEKVLPARLPLLARAGLSDPTSRTAAVAIYDVTRCLLNTATSLALLWHHQHGREV